MSVVTNLVLTFPLQDGIEDGNIIEAVNGHLESVGQVGLFELPTEAYSGTKCLEANVYVAAYNGLDLSRFIAHLRSLKVEGMRLFVQGHGDREFTERLCLDHKSTK